MLEEAQISWVKEKDLITYNNSSHQNISIFLC